MSRAGAGPSSKPAPSRLLGLPQGLAKDQGKLWWQMQGLSSCAHPQGQGELKDNLNSWLLQHTGTPWKTERDVASSEEQQEILFTRANTCEVPCAGRDKCGRGAPLFIPPSAELQRLGG